jgi:hypothetical protein
MEIFRKELQVALFEKATVWCDQDIAEGTQLFRVALRYLEKGWGSPSGDGLARVNEMMTRANTADTL